MRAGIIQKGFTENAPITTILFNLVMPQKFLKNGVFHFIQTFKVFLLFLCKKRNIEDLQTAQVVVQEERESREDRPFLLHSPFFVPPDSGRSLP